LPGASTNLAIAPIQRATDMCVGRAAAAPATGHVLRQTALPPGAGTARRSRGRRPGRIPSAWRASGFQDHAGPHRARPREQQRSGLSARRALHGNLPIPPDPDQMGETARSGLVAPGHPHRTRGMGVAGVDADHRQADPPERVPQPARHGPGLDADASGPRCLLARQRCQGAGIGGHATLMDGPARLIHDTDVSFRDTSRPTCRFIALSPIGG